MSNNNEEKIPLVIPQNIPIVYGNNFGLNVSGSDIAIIILLENMPLARFHMSFELAKGLQEALNEHIDIIEKALGNEIMSPQNVHKNLKQRIES